MLIISGIKKYRYRNISQKWKETFINEILKMGECRKTKNAGIAPLQLPTLAVFQPWGIEEELVVPAVRN